MSAELPTDPERDEDRYYEETALAEQAERDEIDEAASEVDLGAVSVEGEAELSADEDAEQAWAELGTDDKLDVLYMALVEANERLAKAEMNLMLLGQSFVRILQKAGEIPEEASQVKVPKMATSIKSRGR